MHAVDGTNYQTNLLQVESANINLCANWSKLVDLLNICLWNNIPNLCEVACEILPCQQTLLGVHMWNIMWKTCENCPIFTLFSHFSHAFHTHISHACEILHSEIYVKSVWSDVIPFTYIFTHTSHGVSHWLSHVNPHWMAKEFHMQNRAATILTFSNYEVRSSVLLDELGWERLEYVRLEQLAVTMHKIPNDLSPSYLRQIFTNTSNVPSQNLRNSELNYYVPRPRTESAKGRLHYRGSVLWNKIPLEIRNLPSLSVFKTSFHWKDYLNTLWFIVTLIML